MSTAFCSTRLETTEKRIVSKKLPRHEKRGDKHGNAHRLIRQLNVGGVCMPSRRRKPPFGISLRVWRVTRWVLSVLVLGVHLYAYGLKLAETPVPSDALAELYGYAKNWSSTETTFGDTMSVVWLALGIAATQLIGTWLANPLGLIVLLWMLGETAGMIKGAVKAVRRFRRQRAQRRKIIYDLECLNTKITLTELHPSDDRTRKEQNNFCI